MKKTYFIILFSILLIASCNNSQTSKSNPGISWWEEIIWDQTDNGAYSSFTFNGLSPSCSNNPESSTNDFSFFVKEGTENKMVIYFQGGGSCWNYNNCVTEITYYVEKQIMENVLYLNMMSNQDPLAVSLDYGGIFNFVNEKNPFKDWHFIYIPYCTGDLHSGAADAVYTKNSDSVTIRHRGNVNFQLVLQWIKDHYTIDPDMIFMTGISGGSYGSIFNFPYVKESFPDAQMFHLGDSGNGVVHKSFQDTGLPNWHAQIPVNDGTRLPLTSGFTGFTADLNISEVYSTIANYYTSDKFAQITTAWDSTQTYFYNVMVNIDIPGNEGENWDDYTAVWCHWNSTLFDNLDATIDPVFGITGDNYSYFVSTGKKHTILMSNDFYKQQSAGVLLIDWIKAMLAGDPSFVNVQCTGDCGKPDECPTCP